MPPSAPEAPVSVSELLASGWSEVSVSRREIDSVGAKFRPESAELAGTDANAEFAPPDAPEWPRRAPEGLLRAPGAEDSAAEAATLCEELGATFATRVAPCVGATFFAAGFGRSVLSSEFCA